MLLSGHKKIWRTGKRARSLEKLHEIKLHLLFVVGVEPGSFSMAVAMSLVSSSIRLIWDETMSSFLLLKAPALIML